MNVLLQVAVLLIIHQSIARQDKFKIKLTSIDIKHADKDFVIVSGSVDEAKNTLNMDYEVLAPVNDDYSVQIAAHSWVNGTYTKFDMIHILDTVKKLLGYEIFDLQSLYLKHTTPALKWPIQVTKYLIRDYSPDEQKYPEFLPLGKYKVDIHMYSDIKQEKELVFMEWYMDLIPK